MAYSTLPGKRVGRLTPPPTKGKTHRPCKRCGFVRECRPKTVLCQDCVDVCTVAELRLWGVRPSAVKRAQEANQQGQEAA